ncbi:MAG: hypothetical protein R3C12_11330 [Planctomycetaceae bacterium]
MTGRLAANSHREKSEFEGGECVDERCAEIRKGGGWKGNFNQTGDS